MNNPLRKRDRVLRQIAGWSVLFVYLAVLSPAGMAIAASLGSLDRNHVLNFTSTETGMRLVLHHQRICPAHHHGLLARTLTLFAQPTEPLQPDHVLRFGSLDNAADNKLIKVKPAIAADSPIAATPDRYLSQLPQPPTGLLFRQISSGPLGPLLGVRSTVFLI